MNQRTNKLILRQYLSKWKGTRPQTHVPSFSARDMDDFIAISDGDIPVALLHRPTLRLEMREFYPDRRAGSSFDVQRPYHWPSFRGAFLTMCWWIGCQCVCSSSQQVTVTGGGKSLRIRIDETFAEDESGSHTLEFGFDAELGCYAVTVHAELAMMQPKFIEVSNFLAEGMGLAWEEDVKLRHTLWSNRQGGLTYFPHNPLTPNTPGNLDWADRRRVPVGGFIGFGSRPEFNPVLEILSCHSQAISFATCSCSYDEHFHLGCPKPADDDGKYRWDVRYRLVSLPQRFAESLIKRAKLLDFGANPSAYDSWNYLEDIRGAGRHVQPLDQTIPLTPGRAASGSQVIDPRQFLAGLYWMLAPRPGGQIRRDRRTGHRSRGSLRLTGHDSKAHIIGQAIGPSIMIAGHSSFTFSAWVKTSLQRGGKAWLQVDPCTYGPGDCACTFASKPQRGCREWTRLTVTLTPPPEAAFLMVSLHLRGQGDAWFDDIELQRIARS
ncbi:MAG: hypothetical protein IT440_09545 [Phycisphaeraceae bacterium]|nr:hypothetical protein [Phycisphaeraceae bacterium]